MQVAVVVVVTGTCLPPSPEYLALSTADIYFIN